MFLQTLQNYVNEKHQVGEYGGVRIAAAENCELFADTIVEALQLVELADSRRFDRICRHIRWIANLAHHSGPNAGMYLPATKQCKFDFAPESWPDPLLMQCWYSMAIVHESTHGLLHSKNIPYRNEFRFHHERICVAEQNRYLAKLDRVHAGMLDNLYREFDASRWENSWKSSRLEMILSTLKRIWRRSAG